MALIDELGWEGYGYLTSLLQLYSEIGMFELTPTILTRRFGMNKRKISRVLPKLSECLAEVFGSFAEDSQTFEEVCESFHKLEGQNPHGSIKDKSKYRSPHGEEKETIFSSENQPAKKPTKKSALTEAPEEFPITTQMKDWADKNGFTQGQIEQETPNFLDHHRAKANKFKCWESAWKTWMRNSKKFTGPKAVKPIDQSTVPYSEAWYRRYRC